METHGDESVGSIVSDPPTETPRFRRVIKRPFYAAVSGALAFSFAALLTLHQGHGGEESHVGKPVLDGPVGVVAPGEPCPDAVHGRSVAELHTNLPVWQPSKEFNLSDAWTCGNTPVLLYGHVQLSFEDGWAGIPVEEKFASLANDYGGNVETILERPALVQTATTPDANSQILIVNGDILIRVLATGDADVDQMRTILKSIRLPRAGA